MKKPKSWLDETETETGGEALPLATPAPVTRPRVTYQTGHGGSVVIGQPPAEPESTEEEPHDAD